ncbi:MAG: PVC-type heme-binding CxxCH protein [Planctomycetaceae bacterium]
MRTGVQLTAQKFPSRTTSIGAVLLLLLLLCGSAAAANDDSSLVTRVPVFQAGAEGYFSFRIPSLIQAGNGTLLAICEGRKTSRSDSGDIDLVIKSSSDSGRTWSPLRVLYEEGGDAKTTIGNPCPVVDARTGKIWLTFCRDNDQVFVTASSDHGATWSKPRQITQQVKKPEWGWYATGPGVGIQLTQGPHKGRLVIPCDHREKIDGRDVMFSHTILSDDGGQTWKLGGSVAMHTDECQAVELRDGSLLINMRNYWGRDGMTPEKGGMRAVATSKDGGETWSELTFDPALIEPVCQASLIGIGAAGTEPGGLVYSNPASKKERRDLTVRLSRDDGKTWPRSRVLHKGPAAYSCLAGLTDGAIGCLFEAGEKNAYERIEFARFDRRWLTSNELKTGAAPQLSPSVVPETLDEIPRIPPVEPAAALKTFQVLGGFEMQLIASEPLVNDPVDLAYDENGLAYVVEMRDYPFPEKANEAPKEFIGRVRILEDTDGDGRFDKSDVFVDGLSWPTSVVLWKGGAFIAAAPDIWYCKDTDQDRKADVRERVFTGFGRYNVQAIMNNLRWGLDNRIYGAASGNGGLIRYLQGESPQAAGQAAGISLSQRDFAFNPVDGKILAISGGARFGNSFDDWGNRFVCNIRNPAQHVVLPAEYLARNRHLPVPKVMQDVAESGDQIPVYRISPVEPWREFRARRWVRERVNYPRSELVGAGFFTSSSGVTIYRGDAYPGEYRGNIFVADVAGNLVHRQVMKPDGATFRSHRGDEKAEFVASTDIWFRPVNFINAPDGTLHVLDMYRETIEHPWSIPDDIKAKLDLASGNDRGRIYRLAPPNYRHRPTDRLGGTSSTSLVQLLEHVNAWHRETAARLLYQRQDKSALNSLKLLVVRSTSPEGRLAALHLIEGLSGMDDQTLLTALRDSDPHVREHAVQLSEPRLHASEPIRSQVIALANDDEPRVRFQVAFSLGEMDLKYEPALKALASIARRDPSDDWIRTAILSSSGESAERLLAELVKSGPVDEASTEGFAELFNRLALTIAGGGAPLEINRAITSVVTLANENRIDLAFSVAAGLGDGLSRQGHSLNESLETAVPETQAGFAALLDKSAGIAADPAAAVPARVRAVDLLRQGSFESATTKIVPILSPKHPREVQLAAVHALASFAEPNVATILLAQWKQLTPPIRSEVIEALLGRKIWIGPFLDAVEAGTVEPTLVPTPRRASLMLNADAAVKTRAERIFGASAPAPREGVIAKYRAALGTSPVAARGREIFRRECMQCHRVGKEGHDIGPDLATIRHRSPDEILIHVLDPNREVAPNFMNYVVVLKNGRSVTGNIAAETAVSITLKRAENATDTVQRDDVEEIVGTGKSIMPEGIEQKVTPPQMADLIEYLLRPE